MSLLSVDATDISQKQQHYLSLFAAAPTLIKLPPDLPTQFRNKDAQAACVLCPGAVRSERARHIPAHLVEEAVGFGHTVQLVFVLLQQIDVTLLRDELQQLWRKGKKNPKSYSTYN